MSSEANHRLSVEMVAPHAPLIEGADVLVCQLEIPLPVVEWALARARRHRVITMLNPAPMRELESWVGGLTSGALSASTPRW